MLAWLTCPFETWVWNCLITACLWLEKEITGWSPAHTPRHTLLAKQHAIMTGVFVSWLWIEEIFCCQHHTTVVTWPQSAFLRRSLLTHGYCFYTREVENAQSSTLHGVINIPWPLRIHWSQTLNFIFRVNIWPVLEKWYDWQKHLDYARLSEMWPGG